jgi:hypothetical protein
LARILGVDRRNLRKAKVRRVLLDTQLMRFGFLASEQREAMFSQSL